MIEIEEDLIAEERNFIQRFVVGEVGVAIASSSKRKNTSDGKYHLI